MSRIPVSHRIQALQALGFSVQLDGIETEDEQHEALDEVEGMLAAEFEGALGRRDEGLTVVEPTPAEMARLVGDVAPMVPEALNELERAIELASEDEGEASNEDLLMTAYDVLAKRSFVMTLGHWDPIEIGRLLNFILEQHGKSMLTRADLEALEEEMADSPDAQGYVWSELCQELSACGLAIMELFPVGGAWGDQALIVIPSDKRDSWVGKQFGPYGLRAFD